jgi:protein-S-isoprenylcysteine O-methyltransferase Ste14
LALSTFSEISFEKRESDRERPIRGSVLPMQLMRNFVQRGGFWVLSQALLLLAVILLAVRFRKKGIHPVSAISGGILLTSGTAIGLSGVMALGRNITPLPMPSERAELVRTGIFSVIRHPIYAGLVLAVLGWAVLWRSSPATLMALGFIPFLDAKARREEKWLGERFSDYQEYAARVKRFVPRIY